ncbi:hypothetical protein UT300012_23370 [Paraclostridium bifermentans]
MYEEVKVELGKFSRNYCKIVDVLLITLVGASIKLPYGLLALVIGLLYVKLDLKFYEYLHNLMLFLKWYRKLLARIFMKIVKVKRKSKTTKITDSFVEVGAEYMEKYYCDKTNRASKRIIKQEDEVLDSLFISYEEVYEMPCLVQLHLMRSNRWMAITCCVFSSVSSMCLMLMFGGWVMLLFCAEMLAIVLFMCSFSNVTERLTMRAIKGEVTVGDLMFLNSYIDLSV